MNVDIFIPVRMGSSRLPEKHFRKIDGQPVIKYLIERLKSTKKIRNIVVCTTNLKSDYPLVEFQNRHAPDYSCRTDKRHRCWRLGKVYS